MAEVLSTRDLDVVTLMKTMAQYFLFYVLSSTGWDAYSRLIREMRQRDLIDHTLFSTLNYDCLFEIAAGYADLRLQMHSSMPAAGEISILKLHGSCNLLMRDPVIPVPYIATSGVTIQGPADYHHPADAARLIGEQGGFPGMCFYAPGKESPAAPDKISRWQRKWAQYVQGAQTVIVIGSAPAPHDKHIWGPLADTTATLHYVGGDKEFNTWLPARGDRETHFVGKYFDEWATKVPDLLQ